VWLYYICGPVAFHFAVTSPCSSIAYLFSYSVFLPALFSSSTSARWLWLILFCSCFALALALSCPVSAQNYYLVVSLPVIDRLPRFYVLYICAVYAIHISYTHNLYILFYTLGTTQELFLYSVRNARAFIALLSQLLRCFDTFVSFICIAVFNIFFAGSVSSLSCKRSIVLRS